MKSKVIYFQMYDLAHMSFSIAKDMSWFTVDVMAILNFHNAKCDASTQSSKFEIGNNACMQQLAMAEQHFLY